jgi:hypothetical protein
LSTANKLAGSILWVSVLLNLLLLAVVCSHRIEIRKLRSDLSKKPELPELDGFDRAILLYLVGQHLACGVDRMAVYAGKATFEIAFSLDKLQPHGYVESVAGSQVLGGEYRATAKGRAFVMGWKKQK